MKFDPIDTSTVSVKEGELDQIVQMLSEDATVSAEKLVIDTEDGSQVVITGDYEMGIEIEINL